MPILESMHCSCSCNKLKSFIVWTSTLSYPVSFLNTCMGVTDDIILFYFTIRCGTSDTQSCKHHKSTIRNLLTSKDVKKNFVSISWERRLILVPWMLRRQIFVPYILRRLILVPGCYSPYVILTSWQMGSNIHFKRVLEQPDISPRTSFWRHGTVTNIQFKRIFIPLRIGY